MHCDLCNTHLVVRQALIITRINGTEIRITYSNVVSVAVRVAVSLRRESTSVTNGSVSTAMRTKRSVIFFMRHLKNEVPANDNVWYVFYDFGTTQDSILQIKRLYMCLMLFANNSSVPNARMCRISIKIAYSAENANTRSGMTMSATC